MLSKQVVNEAEFIKVKYWLSWEIMLNNLDIIFPVQMFHSTYKQETDARHTQDWQHNTGIAFQHFFSGKLENMYTFLPFLQVNFS